MLTLVLLLLYCSWPAPGALAATFVVIALASTRFGFCRSMAVAALADLTLLPLDWFRASVALLHSGGAHALHRSYEAMPSFFMTQIVIYAFSMGGMLGLLRQRQRPEEMLPVRGVWARRLVAALSIFGVLFVLTGDVWPVFIVGSIPDRFEAALATVALIAYFVPLSQWLVRGRQPSNRQPIRISARSPMP